MEYKTKQLIENLPNLTIFCNSKCIYCKLFLSNASFCLEIQTNYLRIVNL